MPIHFRDYQLPILDWFDDSLRHLEHSVNFAMDFLRLAACNKSLYCGRTDPNRQSRYIGGQDGCVGNAAGLNDVNPIITQIERIDR
jgi:hypothetical protein